MPILDHFSLIARFYDRAIPLQNAENLIRYIGLPIEGKMLDAGGGTGRVAQVLREYADQIVVSDLSLGMLRQAQLKNDLQLTCSHTEKLPFPDETFERIIMVDALHHVCDQQETASEMWRVLKTGGRIVIEEPDIRQFSVKLVALAEKLALMRSHIIPANRMAALFNYPTAQIHEINDRFNVFLIVEKT